ncbi:MAG: DUF1801 domain-containing protein [Caulobacter sp.]|nr:DUF1801 domain-containing protein [Caulobacter sp.]
MAKVEINSVEDYLAVLPARQRDILVTVRAAIAAALPDAEEVISYDIPTFRIGGRSVVHYAGWKRHYSIYPVGDAVRTELAAELAGLEISKGTIKFRLDEPVPVELIGRIARLRAAEEAAQTSRKKRR